MQKKIRVSEVFSLIFGNGLLIACIIFLYWCWKEVQCTEFDYGCRTVAGLREFLSILSCILLLFLWFIFTAYAFVTGRRSGNKRVDVLAVELVGALCLLLIGIIPAFVNSYAILIVAILMCLILIITDILYVRALVLDYKVSALQHAHSRVR